MVFNYRKSKNATICKIQGVRVAVLDRRFGRLCYYTTLTPIISLTAEGIC